MKTIWQTSTKGMRTQSRVSLAWTTPFRKRWSQRALEFALNWAKMPHRTSQGPEDRESQFLFGTRSKSTTQSFTRRNRRRSEDWRKWNNNRWDSIFKTRLMERNKTWQTRHLFKWQPRPRWSPRRRRRSKWGRRAETSGWSSSLKIVII